MAGGLWSCLHRRHWNTHLADLLDPQVPGIFWWQMVARGSVGVEVIYSDPLWGPLWRISNEELPFLLKNVEYIKVYQK